MTRLMGTLERVESQVPERTVALETLGDQLGLSRTKLSLFRKVHGLRTLRLDPALPLLDLVVPPAARVVSTLPDPGHVRYVIHAHAIHELAPAHIDIAGRIRSELGLERAEAFGLAQQNCASGLGALDVATELLRDGAPEDRALVITGEKPVSPVVQMVPNTTIMGEAAAACLVAVGGVGDTLLAHTSRTFGAYADLVSLPAEDAARYGRIYAPMLADVMREAVRAAGLELSDIDLVIPHNVNLLAWRNTTEELGLATERVFLDNVPRYGHCFASDVFVNYTTLRDAGRLTAGRYYLMATVGAGATFSAAVLKHRKGAGDGRSHASGDTSDRGEQQ